MARDGARGSGGVRVRARARVRVRARVMVSIRARVRSERQDGGVGRDARLRHVRAWFRLGLGLG